MKMSLIGMVLRKEKVDKSTKKSLKTFIRQKMSYGNLPVIIIGYDNSPEKIQKNLSYIRQNMYDILKIDDLMTLKIPIYELNEHDHISVLTGCHS